MTKNDIGTYLILHTQLERDAERLLADFKQRGFLLSQHPAHHVHFSHVNTEKMTLVYEGYRKSGTTLHRVTMALPIKCLTEPDVLEQIIANTRHPQGKLDLDVTEGSASSLSMELGAHTASTSTVSDALVVPRQSFTVVTPPSTLPSRKTARPLRALLDTKGV